MIFSFPAENRSNRIVFQLIHNIYGLICKSTGPGLFTVNDGPVYLRSMTSSTGLKKLAFILVKGHSELNFGNCYPLQIEQVVCVVLGSCSLRIGLRTFTGQWHPHPTRQR